MRITLRSNSTNSSKTRGSEVIKLFFAFDIVYIRSLYCRLIATTRGYGLALRTRCGL
ncbi:hypothetical protein M430DRAFT_242751 [Amorphotheca resinae ATCC 22711]|uniref:Uncharacterized protein n=1 Tax=Amorphotheca resinae ATCC 22711 TaxID=857342 RepID=A0A2T3B2D2_AMORE|nr:hypothetical protein M430DRAFT_242751 [Amorphotheca resinae ATCC 22711]PSS18693.1 hypothetical protein M430DRAFT_242751 [Amorphotheca resinae ATCC 22711]